MIPGFFNLMNTKYKTTDINVPLTHALGKTRLVRTHVDELGEKQGRTSSATRFLSSQPDVLIPALIII
jgi:hypothetical protein